MFMIFNDCIYNVCKLLYHSTVHRVYIHGTDMSVTFMPGGQATRTRTQMKMLREIPDDSIDSDVPS